MFSLAEFAASLEKSTVSVRGKAVEIRALSASESARLGRLYPRPLAPLGQDPDGGSKGRAPNEHDEGHRAAVDLWFYQKKVMELAMILGLASPRGKDDDAARAELEKAAADLQDAFTIIEINRVWGACREIFDENVMQKVRDSLVVDAKKYWEDLVIASGAADTGKLPEDYATTAWCEQLDICERFGIDPVKELVEIPPGMMVVLLTHHRYKVQIEARRAGG